MLESTVYFTVFVSSETLSLDMKLSSTQTLWFIACCFRTKLFQKNEVICSLTNILNLHFGFYVGCVLL
jgi:hypothetical protein